MFAVAVEIFAAMLALHVAYLVTRERKRIPHSLTRTAFLTFVWMVVARQWLQVAHAAEHDVLLIEQFVHAAELSEIVALWVLALMTCTRFGRDFAAVATVDYDPRRGRDE